MTQEIVGALKKGEAYIRAVNLLGGEAFAAAQGLDYGALLDEVGIPRQALVELDGLVSFRAFVTCIETAAARSGNEYYGLQLSQSQAPDYLCLGPSILMANFTKDMGEWAKNTLRYWTYHTNGFSMELLASPAEDEAILRIHSNALVAPARQFTECVAANIVGVVRAVAGEPDENPTYVGFAFRRPREISMHETIFRCPVAFGCEHTEIRFQRKFLSHPTKGSLRLLKPLMRLYIEERIRRMHIFDHSTMATVALAIPTMLGTGNCNIEAVAQSLGTNVKALQRQLEKDDTSFSNVLDDVRENMARHLLTESEAPVSRVAGLLEYASTAPFSMAFRRWTGQTPLEYRKRSRKVDIRPDQ